jgi:hypothetical protein
VRDVALHVDLGLLRVGGDGQCHVPVDARARAGGNPKPPLACRVPALKDHDDARPRVFDPSLQAGKLDLELREFFLEFLAFHCRMLPLVTPLHPRGGRKGRLVKVLYLGCYVRHLNTGHADAANRIH